MCVCVSHPVPKGSTSRGHRPIVDTCANEAVPRWGMRRLITSVYLQPELLTTLSNLLCLFPLFFMLPHPKNRFPAAVQPLHLALAVKH